MEFKATFKPSSQLAVWVKIIEKLPDLARVVNLQTYNIAVKTDFALKMRPCVI